MVTICIFTYPIITYIIINTHSLKAIKREFGIDSYQSKATSLLRAFVISLLYCNLYYGAYSAGWRHTQ